MKLLVKDVFEISKTLSLIVNEEEEIYNVIKQYAENPSLRGIFVVDKERRLKGIITRNDLLQWAKFRIGTYTNDYALILDKIDRYVYSTTVKDIIHRDSSETYVKPEDNLTSALDMMFNEDVLAIPVVDEEKKILGDLMLSEVLYAIVQRAVRDPKNNGNHGSKYVNPIT
jgi:CBS-domain-containing membrane protein